MWSNVIFQIPLRDVNSRFGPTLATASVSQARLTADVVQLFNRVIRQLQASAGYILS
jgi:hypothetical protein